MVATASVRAAASACRCPEGAEERAQLLVRSRFYLERVMQRAAPSAFPAEVMDAYVAAMNEPSFKIPLERLVEVGVSIEGVAAVLPPKLGVPGLPLIPNESARPEESRPVTGLLNSI